jgi:MFS family permease
MQHPPIDYNRKWLVMSAVAMGIFLGTIDGSIVNVALPTLVADLQTNFATVQWVVLAYLLALGQTTGIAVLGSIWTGRVYAYAGTVIDGGATAAPPALQVAGLQDTYFSIAFVIIVALALGIWGYVQERGMQAVPKREASPQQGK